MISGLESNSVLGLFLTGDVVLVSAVGEKRLQLAETLPGLRSAVEASQVVQVRSWTEDKQTNISFMFLSWSLLMSSVINCVSSPLVRVAEVRPEFSHTFHVETERSAIDEFTPSGRTTQWGWTHLHIYIKRWQKCASRYRENKIHMQVFRCLFWTFMQINKY